MDNWNILLEKTHDGFTLATVLEVPDLQTTAERKQDITSDWLLRLIRLELSLEVSAHPHNMLALCSLFSSQSVSERARLVR